MPEGSLYTLRMVVQQLGISETAPYRLIVYGDDQHPRHSDFENVHILLERLRAAIPDFDFSTFTLNPLSTGQGSMAFTGEVKLNHCQLSLLGLL